MSEPFVKEDLFSEARKLAQFGYWHYSFNTKKFVFSEELKNILDLDFESSDFNGLEVLKNIIHPDELSKVLQIKDDLLNGKLKVLNTIINLLGVDLSSKFVEVKAKVLHQNGDTILTGTALDITESYYKTVKIESAEKIYHNIFEYITDVFIVFDPKIDATGNVFDFGFRDVNETFVKKLNIPKSQLVKKVLSDFGDEFESLRSMLKITFITGQPQQDRLFLQSFDSFYDVLIYCPTASTIATIWRDVSLLVDADNLLHDSEKKYRELFMRMSDGVLMVDEKSGEILDANTVACQMTGLDRNQLSESNIEKLFPNLQFTEVGKIRQPFKNADAVLHTADNKKLPVEIKMSFYHWFGRKVVLLDVRDVQLRIEKYNDIIESKKWYEKLLYNLDRAVFVLNDFKIEYCNDKALKLFGLSFDYLGGKTLGELSPLKQPDGNKSIIKIAKLQRKALSGNEVEVEWVFLYGARHEFTSNMTLTSFDHNGSHFVVASVSDIGIKKKIEFELKTNESRWRNALESGKIGVWDWDVLNNEVHYSDVWKKMLGYEPDEISNRFEEFEKRVHPDDVALVFNKIELFVEKKTPRFDIVFRLRTKNGSYKWVNASGCIYHHSADGSVERFVGINYEVTGFKMSIQKLINENRKYVEGFKNVLAGIWSLNLKNMLFSAPQETLILLGVEDSKVFSLRDIESLVHPADHRAFISQFVVESGNVERECVFRVFVQEHLRFFSSFARPLYDENDQLTGFTGVFQDITKHKQQELLYKNEQILNEQFIRNSKQTILVYQNQEVVYANNKFKDLFGYDFENFKANKYSLFDIILPQDRDKTIEIINSIFNKKKGRETAELRIITRLNREKWVDVVFTTIHYNDSDALLVLLDDITKRKNYELKLKSDEFVWRNIFQNNPIGILYVDSKLNVISANNAFYQISESHKSIKSKWSLSASFSEPDIEILSEYVSNILSGQMDEHIGEYTLKGNVQVKLSINSFTNDILDKSGCVLFFENVDIDKKQINMLSDSNFIYKKVLENSNAGIALFDDKGVAVLYNEMFLANCSIKKKDGTTISFDDIAMLNDGKSLMFRSLEFHDKNEISFFQRLLPDKVLFYELQKVDFISSFGVLLLVRDITFSYKENNRNIELHQKYFSIFEQVPYGIALVDKKRTVVVSNSAYTSIFGIKDFEPGKYKVDSFIKTEKINQLIDVYDRLFSGVIESSYDDYEIIREDEKRCYISVKSKRFIDEYGDAVFILQIVEDKTDDYFTQVEQLNTERMQTLSFVADNLLLKIYNYLIMLNGSAFMLAHIENESIPIPIADKTYNYTTKLLNNIRQLLSFSEHYRPLQIRYNSVSVVEQALASVNMDNSLTLQVEYPEEQIMLRGELFMLVIALQNIIQNAVEAMFGGGVLKVKSALAFFNLNSKNLLFGEKSGRYLRIEISDSGKGISSAFLPEKIFEPFFTNGKSDHLGIGLTVAKIIVEKNGGELKVQSSKSGTRVNVYLPALDKDEEDVLNRPSEMSVSNDSKNILLVDDDDVVRNITFELVKNLKFNVVAFGDGDQALRYFKKNQNAVDLVFVDSGIYASGNTEFTTALQIVNPEVKIVLMKNCDDEEAVNRILSNNSLLEVKKPLNIEDIFNAISTLLVGV